MRIERVEVTAFGPLTSQTLELGQALTVIAGPNESAKSTWHAAIVAALGGRRRGQGKPSKAERRFVELHAPWDGGPWRVGASVRFDDGRLVHVEHDLAGKVACRVIDLTDGRDVSAEFTNDGAVDLMTACGLTRTLLPLTASIAQNDVLAVAADPAQLADVLSRAATGSNGEDTAADAIGLIDAALSRAVGSERAGSTKPLARARADLDAARSQLASARSARRQCDDAAEQLGGLLRQARDTDDELRYAQARAGVERSRRCAADLRQAQSLAELAADAHAGAIERAAAELAAADADLAHAAMPVTATAPATGGRRHTRASGWWAGGAALFAAAAVGLGLYAGGVWRAVGVAAALAALAGAGALARRQRTRAAVTTEVVDSAPWASALSLARGRVVAAEQALAASLTAAGSSDGDDPRRSLARWRAAGGAQEAAAAAAQLAQLVGPGGLPGLESEAARAAEEARAAIAGCDPARLAVTLAVSERELQVLAAAARSSSEQAQRAAGAVDQLLASLPDVAAAEEELASAEANVARLEGLSQLLSTARQLLVDAQQAVHRDLAPQLGAAISRHLATVTAGRYTQALVDPATLDVSVRGDGPWRRAALLSVGTAEQIHLLLRIALVDVLTVGRERCPLIVDDVTVHADADRTHALLELLASVAEHRQVVLFSQEQAVAAWARTQKYATVIALDPLIGA